MRLSLRLTLFLVVGISFITFVVARYQIAAQEQVLRTDLVRRAAVLAESLREIVEPILERNDLRQLRLVVERFGNRERLVGVAVHDEQGKITAVTSNISIDARTSPALDLRPTDDTLEGGTSRHVRIGNRSIHVYSLGLRRNGAVSGYITIYHDAGYIDNQRQLIWKDTIWHVVAQVLLVVLAIFLIVRWAIVSPLARITHWIRELKAGRFVSQPVLAGEEFIGPLSREVADLARSLAEARSVAKEEARLRATGEALWTAERLKLAMRTKLQGSRLLVVSNREPYEHVRRGKNFEAVVPASGLVTALEPILRACEGTWVAHGSGEADRETVDDRDRVEVPPEHPCYTLRRVWLNQREVDGYYLGFANEGLWPLCHIAHTRPIFRYDDWACYQRVNERFAKAVLEEIEGAESPIVLIQDYHFALLPRLIKEARPEARVAIFWHIPWPNPEAFGICPWQRELLDGLLGADLLGFHIQSHCNNFLETVDRVFESQIDWEQFAVNRRGRLTLVRPFPISVAFPDAEREPTQRALPPSIIQKAAIFESLGIEAAFLGIGVDRIDYTKGIVERFRGIERFLETNRSYREKFTFVQIGAPSRTSIKRYQDFLSEVEGEVARINRRFETKRWKPIVLRVKHHSHEEIRPFYRAADVCLVSSLHDGMNLVAKEFVAERDDDGGMLIVSKFTGASRELRDALIVNPYDVDQIAEAIRCALEMPPEDRRARMRSMRRIVKEHNVYWWAAELTSALADLRLETPEVVSVQSGG